MSTGSGSRTLFFFEKPSAMRQLQRFFKSPTTVCVSAEGHLLAAEEPGDVRAEWKPWRFDALPIVLEHIPTTPGKNRSGQSHRPKIDAIKQELQGVQRVIIATDPGREGSMIAWEVLEHLGYKGHVDRLKLGALDEISIRRAFTAMAQEPASGERDYAAYLEALCRQYEDYHLGLNGTRAISLRLRPPAFREPWRFGGVQTPTLAILADLEQRIRDFVPQDFYKVALVITTEGGAEITLWHAPEGQDLRQGGRGDNPAGCCFVVRPAQRRAEGCASLARPSLFSKDTLARRCAKRFGWDPQHTAKLAQELYDQGYLSYPRNRVRAPAREPDGRCWRGDRERNRGAARSCASRASCRQAHLSQGQPGPLRQRPGRAPCHRAAAQSAPAGEQCSGDHFRSVGAGGQELPSRAPAGRHRCSHDGRRPRLRPRSVPSALRSAEASSRLRAGAPSMALKPTRTWTAVPGKAKPDAEPTTGRMPPVHDGEPGQRRRPVIETAQTEPPRRITRGELPVVMGRLIDQVDDPKLKAALENPANPNEPKGLGTAATRDTILPKLLKSQYVDLHKGKDPPIEVTEVGLAFIAAVRRMFPAYGDPVGRAVFEAELAEIGRCVTREEAQRRASAFRERTRTRLEQLVQAIAHAESVAVDARTRAAGLWSVPAANQGDGCACDLSCGPQRCEASARAEEQRRDLSGLPGPACGVSSLSAWGATGQGSWGSRAKLCDAALRPGPRARARDRVPGGGQGGLQRLPPVPRRACACKGEEHERTEQALDTRSTAGQPGSG